VVKYLQLFEVFEQGVQVEVQVIQGVQKNAIAMFQIFTQLIISGHRKFTLNDEF
jgi:hypothetical protein